MSHSNTCADARIHAQIPAHKHVKTPTYTTSTQTALKWLRERNFCCALRSDLQNCKRGVHVMGDWVVHATHSEKQPRCHFMSHNVALYYADVGISFKHVKVYQQYSVMWKYSGITAINRWYKSIKYLYRYFCRIFRIFYPPYLLEPNWRAHARAPIPKVTLLLPIRFNTFTYICS